MVSRKISFAEGEIYHIYNRGVDKRSIFENSDDLNRFLQSMIDFNSIEPIGSIYEKYFSKDKPNSFGHGVSKTQLVSFVNFCLNQNHFHFSLRQEAENGIQKFLQRLSMGYSKYFNNKYHRSGALFQGSFRAKHVESNEYLLHLSAYVNLNNKVHKQFGHGVSKSSWDEYIKGISAGHDGKHICDPRIVLDQFTNTEDYRKFAEEALLSILEKKDEQKELEKWLE